MMRLLVAEVESTLYKTIMDLGLVPLDKVATENRNADNEDDSLRLVLERVAPEMPIVDLANSIECEHGVLSVSIIAPKQTSSKFAMQIADELRRVIRAPYEVVMPSGGTIQFGNVNVRSGYPDYGSWRLPCEVSYYAEVDTE